jgi:hypothetical protein
VTHFVLTFVMLYLVVGSACRAVIDINSSPGSRPPEPSVVSYSPPPQAAFDSRPVPPALSLRLVEANNLNDRKKGLIDLRVQNLSEHSIEVPISRDGKKAFELCGIHPLLKSTILGGRSESGKEDRQLSIELYGCNFFEGSTINLMTGDWITVAGIPSPQKPGEPPPKAAFTYSLDVSEYSHADDKVKVASRGLYFIRSD